MQLFYDILDLILSDHNTGLLKISWRSLIVIDGLI